MSKIEGTEREIQLMVNCKTYPAVSKKYTETVCTGGVTSEGDFIRLYPVPFRFLDEEQKYKRWDVIRVKAYRDTKDKRPESWHLSPGCEIKIIDRVENEDQRWKWMEKVVYPSTAAMDEKDITNGCVQIEPISLYWKKDPGEWTASQKSVIQQGDLFATKEQKRGMAERIPWQFRLKYREVSTGREDDNKVLAWSYYQGFLRHRNDVGDEQSLEGVCESIRKSIFDADRVVFGIFGTHSRFGDWMISALYHLPRSIQIRRGLF